MTTKTVFLAGLAIFAMMLPVQTAMAQNNEPPPSGAILDLNGTQIPGNGDGETYQQYTVDFTGNVTNTDITFAFREDPAFISFTDVSVVDLADPNTNLLQNGNFQGGVYCNNGNCGTPVGWRYANVYGAAAGGFVDTGCSPAPSGNTSCWFDGAVQAYDAIDQMIPTQIGHNYRITFFVADSSGCSTDGGPPCNFMDISNNGEGGVGGNGINVLAYAQAGLPPPPPVQFVALPPCRVVDTRPESGGDGPIQGGTSEDFALPDGDCNIPTTATVYSLNVTVVPNGRLGYLTIWPTGQDQPLVSLMNSLDGRIKANAAIVPGGADDAVSVYVSDTTNVVIDIDGYFASADDSTLAFYPLTPCRVVDTRNANGHLGGPFLASGVERDFPVLESTCIPQGVTPAAYSFNVTAVPHPAGQRLGYLSVWPVGQQQPVVSTLNNPTGTIVANAAIVPAGTEGAIAVFPNNNTDLLIDIDGYFAAPDTGGLSLYPTALCRVLDTRDNNGQPFQGERTVNVVGSSCAPPATAQAYVFNATVVPPGHLGYLTLWPDGEDQPVVSTLNASDAAITSNMAIVPTNNGSIDAYASALTQLILDISSYFAP